MPEQEKTLAALKTAIQMELDGKRFYLKTSQASSNPLGKELLKKLASEEDNHRRRFEEIYKALQKKKAWTAIDFHPEMGKGLRTIFARELRKQSPATAPQSELDAVKTAMDMENKTFDFYKKQGERANFEAEKEYYEIIASEEKEHHLVLLDYYEFLKNPAGWFVQKEHHSLDGG